MDENALSGALRELFDESGIGRRVRVGVANQRHRAANPRDASAQ